eukprot:TRINITY_DN20611_c0_g1_i2.p1 TRINITY_DN20611_c0_g1~~TRINITY_DN20611_c0_g1_i2.p1  ORF type:complete len:760 (-),score=165.69 TRINITY_DN20611_c0_g1_i2:27-2306(-)
MEQQQESNQQDWEHTRQHYQNAHEECWAHSFADGSYASSTPEPSQMSATAPSFNPQIQTAGTGNTSCDASSPGNQISLFADSNRMYSPHQNQVRMIQQAQPENSFSSLSAAAPAFTPVGSTGQEYSGVSAGVNYQQSASDSMNTSAEMWTDEYDGWAYSDEMGWYQYDSSTYAGGYQADSQTARKQNDGSGLSSNALPFIPGEGAAAAAASIMSANAKEFSPSGTDNPGAQTTSGMESWGHEGQDEAWGSAQETWGSAQGDQGQEAWRDVLEEPSGTHNQEWPAKNGASKSGGKSWRSDAKGWEGGGQTPGKGWENAGKGWEGKGWESTVLDKLFDPTPKGKGWEVLSTKGKSWETSSKAGWSGTPKGKPWDSIPKGKGWEGSANGKSASWEGNIGNGKEGKGWDASYAGKGWENASKGWPGKGWEAKGKDPSMGQNYKGWDNKGWHGEKGKDSGDWAIRGGKSWSGDPAMQGKGWEMGPAFEGKDHRGQRGKGRTDHGRNDGGTEVYEDGRWDDGWLGEGKWDDQWDDKWQGGWKDEWWSEWRGPEEAGNGENEGKGGSWKQHGDWRQERRQEKRSPAKNQQDKRASKEERKEAASRFEKAKGSEKNEGDRAALGRRPPLRRRAPSSGSEQAYSSAPSSAGSHQPHSNRKGRGKSGAHAREGSPAQSAITVSEDEADEDVSSRRRDARGDFKGRGRGKGRSVGDEAAPRSKLRQMWQQQREDERRKNQPAGHQSEDDDDQGGAKAALDTSAVKRHLGI